MNLICKYYTIGQITFTTVRYNYAAYFILYMQAYTHTDIVIELDSTGLNLCSSFTPPSLIDCEFTIH